MDTINYSYLVKGLLIMYIISFTPITSNLISQKLKQSIMQNRFAQHIIGIVTVMVVMNLLGITNVYQLLKYTAVLFILFLLSTKLNLSTFILIITLLLISYLIEVNFDNKIKRMKNDQMISNEIISNEMKIHKLTRYLLLSLIGFIIIYDVCINYKNKEIILEDDFNPIRFFLDGKTKMNGGGIEYVNYKI